MSCDSISIAETAYRREPGFDRWLENVVGALTSEMACEGLVGVLADASAATDATGPKLMSVRGEGLRDDVYRCLGRMVALPTPQAVRAPFIRNRVGSLNRMGAHGACRTYAKLLAEHAIQDAMYLLAGDLLGSFCVFATPSAKPLRLSAARRAHLERLGAHLGSGLRLQLGPWTEPEAILSPDGRVEHAEGPACCRGGLDALRSAAKASERARGPLRRQDPERALRFWRTLVGGRWSLVDWFDSDGRRYLIARVNEPRGAGSLRLSQRESQVARLVAGGLSNKWIGYELGIAPATVGVLLSRALQKLGLRSRVHLARLCRSPSGAPAW